jgi:iron complex transport system substrate-binding protein
MSPHVSRRFVLKAVAVSAGASAVLTLLEACSAGGQALPPPATAQPATSVPPAPTVAPVAPTAAPVAATTAPVAATVAPTTPAATRTIQDMQGRSVQIPTTVNRVATNYPIVTQFMHMLGAPDKMAAVVERADITFFTKLYPRLPQIPIAFTSAGTNMETLLSTKPDVVISLVTRDDVIAAMTSAGLPVVVLSSFANPDELKRGVSILADVLGPAETQVSQHFAQTYDANVQRVTAITRAIPIEQRPRAFFETGTALGTEAKGTITESWMDTAGAVNVAAAAGVPNFPTVTLEQLIGWNPDVIVCRDPSVSRTIQADPQWQTINAVKNNRVVINPWGLASWATRTAEEALQVLWAPTIFHPDQFADMDMRQQTKAFYADFHRYQLSDADLDAILQPTTP